MADGKDGKMIEVGVRRRRGGLVAYARRHAWLGFLVIGFLGLAFGSFLYATAQPPELETFERITGVSWAETKQSTPGMAEYVSITLQSEAQFMLAFGVFVIALAFLPYRKGEPWAWYVMWVVPVLLITLGLRVVFAGGTGWALIAFQLVLALGALVLPYRIFFPNAQEGDAADSLERGVKEGAP